MQYRYLLRKKATGEVTHRVKSTDAEHEMEIPQGWGYIHEGFYSEAHLENLGLLKEDALSTRETEDGKTEYFFQANYEVVREEIAENKKLKRKLKLKELLESEDFEEAVLEHLFGDSRKLDKLKAKFQKFKTDNPE